MKTACKFCGQRIEFPDEMELTTIPCPACSKPVVIGGKKSEAGVETTSKPTGKINPQAATVPASNIEPMFNEILKQVKIVIIFAVILNVLFLYLIFRVSRPVTNTAVVELGTRVKEELTKAIKPPDAWRYEIESQDFSLKSKVNIAEQEYCRINFNSKGNYGGELVSAVNIGGSRVLFIFKTPTHKETSAEKEKEFEKEKIKAFNNILKAIDSRE